MGGRGEVTTGELVLVTSRSGMYYADDAGVVSPSPEQLRKIMGVIAVVWVAFGLLTVSEAKTEIHVFTHEEDGGVHRHIQRKDSGPGVQPNGRVHIPRGERQPQCRSVY